MWLRPKTSFLKILRGDDWNSEPEDANQWRNLFSFPSVRLFRSNKLLHWSPNHLKIKEKKSILNTAVTVCVNVPCNRCQVCSDLVVVVQRIKKKQRPNQGGGGRVDTPGGFDTSRGILSEGTNRVHTKLTDLPPEEVKLVLLPQV